MPRQPQLEIYACSIRHRSQLVGLRTQSKNRIHALIVRYNLRAPVTDLFGVRGREILTLEIMPQLRSATRKVLGNHLHFIDQLNAQITAMKVAIELTQSSNKPCDY